MRVLGIEVARDRLQAWRNWLAPTAQPFFVRDPAAVSLAVDDGRDASPELRDTFQLWKVSKELPRVWLTEAEFSALPRPTRARLVREQVEHRRGAVPSVWAWRDLVDEKTLRAQADGHRFVWWPSLITNDNAEAVLVRHVERGRLPSRHRDVPKHVWRRCAAVVPGAQQLAGTFPAGSGPNCFGTVLAACGVAGAADDWVLQPQFEKWLAHQAGSKRADTEPGSVLVWRDHDGLAQHAAITLGGGWALEKPSQEWSSPRAVAAVADVIRTARTAGWRLTRYAVALVGNGARSRHR